VTLRHLVVSVHDVAPTSRARVEAILQRLSALGITRRSLLVIPNLRGTLPIDQDAAFCEWLRGRQAEGDDIVLHGYEHVAVGAPRGMIERFRNRWFTNNEGEFLSLEYDDAADRVRRGRTLLRRAGFDASGFVAPAWLINGAGLRAIRDLGFAYTNSYLGFIDLQQQERYHAPSLVFGPGRINEDLGIVVQRRSAVLLGRCPVVRVVLHPPCVDHSERMRNILEIVDAQRQARSAITYTELLTTYRRRSLSPGSRGDVH
jgi:hypothetical protein